MAISAVLLFNSDADVCKIYDDVTQEMGVRDVTPPGLIYHWCAAVKGGLRFCDLWETREQFERFGQDALGPAAAKHGLSAPLVEITTIHEMVVGQSTTRAGLGLFVEWEGDTNALLHKIDDANTRMNVVANPPQGLSIHWTVPSITGIRVIDHWCSRDDFEHFVHSRLGEAMDAVAMPAPRITEFQVHNAIDRRIAAHV